MAKLSHVKFQSGLFKMSVKCVKFAHNVSWHYIISKDVALLFFSHKRRAVEIFMGG